MFSENGGRPGDQRGFLHKSIVGKVIGKAVTTFVPGASTAVNVFETGRSLFDAKQQGASIKFGNGASSSAIRSITGARPSTICASGFRLGRDGPCLTLADVTSGGLPFGGSGPCDFPKVIDSAGRCRTPTSGEFGGEQFGVGAAVMGRYGAALEPGSQIIDRAICLRGMQLGDDGLCYNKSQITNKQRMWPAGRKPLLSGGDMRAISIAARAGRRLEGATKRLQRLGMMKKPARSAQRRVHPALKVPVHQVVDV